MASEYELQAADFLASIGAKFETKFLRSGRMQFDDDAKDERDIYLCKLTRDGRSEFVTEFGQSLAKSVDYARDHCRCRVYHREFGIHDLKCSAREVTPGARDRGLLAPTAYDLLACITKFDPGTFADFCSDFGYDTDSRKALDLFLRVQEEWSKVRKFFTAEELEQVQGIS